MAYIDFIKQNTYTLVDNVSYSKKNKTLSFDIICYESKDKKMELLHHNLSYSFNEEVSVIEEYFTSRKQLEKDKLSFIISPAEDNGYFTKRIQSRIEADGSKQVSETIETGNTPKYIYLPSITSYMIYNNETKRYEQDSGLNTIHFWDNNLAPDKLKKYDNILELAYTFAYNNVELLKGLKRD
jgi:hypothetical protein